MALGSTSLPHVINVAVLDVLLRDSSTDISVDRYAELVS
jgi:hypothetical protein